MDIMYRNLIAFAELDFPTSKLMNRSKGWSINLAVKAIEDAPIVAAKLRKNGKKHESKRHAILATVINLINQNRENQNAVQTTPLHLLEVDYFRQRRKMRFTRTYFLQVLPPRIRKSKPRKKIKQSKKDQKRRQKRKQQAKKVVK